MTRLETIARPWGRPWNVSGRVAAGSARGSVRPPEPPDLEVALLTGGQDRHYAFGLTMALAAIGTSVDVIGSDDVDSPELHRTRGITFLNLRRQRAEATRRRKVAGVVMYYARLLRYAATARPKVFHILWNGKIELFDRTLLMLCWKALGKKVALTAHNVNAGTRDATDTWMNRVTLAVQYRLADHVFVHTERMKRELAAEFGVRDAAITVVPYGINNAVPDTGLTPSEARRRLGLGSGDKTILFFGNIAPYKGLDDLVSAFHRIAGARPDYRLVIAGRPKKGTEAHWEAIRAAIDRGPHPERIVRRIDFIPDADAETYFKAADVLALPYRHIFQSGVLFFGYSFGLPVVVADVGALKEDVVEGETGFVFRPGDPVDLARAIETYFSSALYAHLARRRLEIRRYAHERHSWDVVAGLTRKVYRRLAWDE